jgi:enoyl-CoA hydratase/carnithine racemase
MLSIDGPWDGIATLTLDRPERKNALSVELRDRLSDVLDALAAQEALRVVVLTGEGDVFCAGFDLKEFESALEDPEFGERLWASSDRYHRTVLNFPLPILAAVNGPAIAGGFDLAVMSDLRIASETATFSHPEVTFGDVVYAPLHDLVGAAVARDLCFTGRTIDAA